MSRNLGRTNCVMCDDHVKIVGEVYLRKMGTDISVVGAEAHCEICGAKYFAWLNEPESHSAVRHRMSGTDPFYDLSWMSSMNDEPGDSDLPKGKVERFTVIKIDGVVVSEVPVEC